MQNIIYLLSIFILLSCSDSEDKQTPLSFEKIKLPIKSDKQLKINNEKLIIDDSIKLKKKICSGKVLDFLKLKNKKLQHDFFSKLDSIRKYQYPEYNDEMSIMVDLTPEYLERFLEDLNQDSLLKNKTFEKEYHFNIAPKDYSDPEACKDKIEISFDDNSCSYRLIIYNTFLVDLGWCVESTISYGFRIQNELILDIWRQEAG